MSSSADRSARRPVVAIVTTAEWYFLSHRMPVALRALESGFDVLVVAAEERGLGREIEANGLRFVPWKLQRGSVTPSTELRSLWDLFRIYAHERPLLVHHIGMKPALYGAIASRWASVPSVINALAGRGYLAAPTGAGSQLLRSVMGGVLRVCLSGPGYATIFQNPDDLGFFTASGGIRREDAFLIRGSGVSLDAFPPKPEPSGEPVVVFASRLLWSKGIGELVEATARLRSRGQPVRLVVAGVPDSRNPEAVPESTLREWHSSGIVDWIGLRTDIASVLQSANVVALPTKYGEGVPKVLLEAAASARAIIATDAPGCREVAVHDVNALLVPPGDVDSLTRALAALVGDPERRRAMGAAGRQLIEQAFSDDIVAEQTIEVYRRLLGHHFPCATREPRREPRTHSQRAWG